MSDEDFFNSFGPPPKQSKALKAPGSTPGPPPPPPRQRAGPPSGTSGNATGTTRARPPPKGSGTTASGKQLYGTANPAPTGSTTGSSTTGTAAKSRAPLRTTRQPRQSRIASGGTQSQAGAAASSSNSYYGQQSQQQSTGAKSIGGVTSLRGTTGQYSSPHLTTTTTTTTTNNSGDTASQPSVFNPAAASPAPGGFSAQKQQQGQQPQGTNFYAASNATSTTTTDSSGDWFQPDAAPDNSNTQQQQQQQQAQFQQQPQANATNTNPYAQSSLFPSSSSLASSNNSMEGSMDNKAPGIFTPMAAPSSTGNPLNNSGSSGGGYNPHEFDNEPPLLEELGINIEHILLKTKAVVVPFKRFSGGQSALLDPKMIVEDADLAGPLAFAMLLGGELLLTGKIHFGYIYGFGVFGCLSMTLILNLMSPSQAVSVWTVASILGYALLPVNLLAAVKILVMNIANLSTLGQILAFITVLWSTTASTRLLEVGCGMRDQRYLLAYPIALLYSAFVLITIF